MFMPRYHRLEGKGSSKPNQLHAGPSCINRPLYSTHFKLQHPLPLQNGTILTPSSPLTSSLTTSSPFQTSIFSPLSSRTP